MVQMVEVCRQRIDEIRGVAELRRTFEELDVSLSSLQMLLGARTTPQKRVAVTTHTLGRSVTTSWRSSHSSGHPSEKPSDYSSENPSDYPSDDPSDDPLITHRIAPLIAPLMTRSDDPL